MSYILVLLDDWEGLYHNGSLVLEGHSLPTLDLITILTGEKPGTRDFSHKDLDYLPDSLDELECQ